MLEQGGTLLPVKFGRVYVREAGVQRVLDGQLELGAGRGLLLPVQDEQLLQPLQKLTGDLFTSARSSV